MTRNAAWLVPAAAVALIGGGVAASASATSGTPDLADRTPAQLLVSVASADVEALSGTVRTEADLGFPQLPDMGGATASSDPQAVLTRLLAGDNTIRVWVDGASSSFRAALVDDFSELEVVGDGTEVWTYSSTEDAATRYQLPTGDDEGAGDRPTDLPSGAPSIEGFTPDAMAQQALAGIDPTTEVTVGDSQVVAGRDAYTLVVAPRTAETLVDRIEVAVDAETSFPLQVQVFARDQSAAAFTTGFTDIDFATPDAEVFDFTPPADATVTDGEMFGRGSGDDTARGAGKPQLPELNGEPQVLGEGWSSILELPMAVAPAGTDATPDDSAEATAMLDQLTQRVDGGRAVSTALLSILLADDGRVLVGAVPVDALVAAAAG